MHIGCKFRTNTDDHIIKYQRTSSFYSDLYNLVIFYIQTFGIFRCHMNMTLSYNQALIQANRLVSMSQDDTRCSFDITTFANGSLGAQLQTVCQGNFYLRMFANRSQNNHIVKSAFWTDNCQSFLTSELAWL